MALGTRIAHSDRLVDLAQPVWQAILAHPFLRDLRDGTLPTETFGFYIEQDWLYIQERIGEWAIAAGRCPDPGIRRELALLIDQVARLEPAAFHLKHAPALGLDLERVTWEMNAANWAYTTHELAAVYAEIERELRSRYLLAFQSGQAAAAGGYRQIEVKMRRSGLRARTARGYYP